jgi:hypothetical protein
MTTSANWISKARGTGDIVDIAKTIWSVAVYHNRARVVFITQHLRNKLYPASIVGVHAYYADQRATDRVLIGTATLGAPESAVDNESPNAANGAEETNT